MRPDMPKQVAALEPNEGSGPDRAAFPQALRSKAQEGWEAYQRGSIALALPPLQAAAAHPAAPPWVVYVLGWTQYGHADPAAASASWERVRKSVPEFNAVYFDLADAYLQQREFGKAIDVLRVAEKRWPKDVEVYNALGVIQLVRGAIDDAIATFEKGVAVGPDDPTAAYNLARTSELRFVRASRLHAVGPGAVEMGPIVRDRDRAVEYYRRTVALGGPFAEKAQEGLARLSAK